MSADLLSASEADALRANEDKVSRGLATFVEVGTALAEIRDRRLYRATHGTFEDYCSGRWGMVASRARQLIGAAEVVAQIESVTNVTLANEGQARAIAPVLKAEGPERAAEVLRAASDGGALTARSIADAARPAKVTTTTRTTEATKVEQVVDMETGEVLNEDVTAEQWQAENAIHDFISSGSDVRRANLRARLSKWLLAVHEAHLFDPAEMADVYPERSEDVASAARELSEWAAQYASALRSQRLRVVKEAK